MKIKTSYISVLIIMVICLSCVFSACNTNKDEISEKLVSDLEHSKKAIGIAENAQYLPDPNRVYANEEDNNEVHILNSSLLFGSNDISSDNGNALTKKQYKINKEEFEQISEKIGGINMAALAKHQGYSILEIKKEIMYVLEKAPYFGQWFQFPYDLEIPDEDMRYMCYWVYKLSFDEESNRLSVTRVSDKQRARFYDKDKDVLINNDLEMKLEGGGGALSFYENPDRKSILTSQRQVMQTEYYFDEADEVVECSIVDIMYDGNKIYPLRYEYLKNVKDKSITKYEITSSKRMRTYEFHGRGEHNYEKNVKYTASAYDITSNTPYGQETNFFQMNYEDENNMNIINIHQTHPTELDFYPRVTSVTLYSIKNGNSVFYNSLHSYYDREKSRFDRELKTTNLALEKPQVGLGVFMSIIMRIGTNNNYTRTAYNFDWWTGYKPDKSVKIIDGFYSKEYVTESNRYTYVYDDKALDISEYINEGVFSIANNIKIDNELQKEQENILGDGYDVEGKSFAYEENLDRFLFLVCKHIVDNHLIRNNLEKMNDEIKEVPEITLIETDK